MTLPPESFAGRCLAIALPLCVILLISLYVIAPAVGAFTEQLEDIDRGKRLYEEFGSRVTSLESLKAQLNSLQTQPGSSLGYLTGPNAGFASSALQANARKLLEGSGGSLRSLQVLPPAEENGLQKLAIRLDSSIPMGRVLDFLYDLETSDPYLFIDNLDIRAPDARATAPNASTPINIRADVYGYFQTP